MNDASAASKDGRPTTAGQPQQPAEHPAQAAAAQPRESPQYPAQPASVSQSTQQQSEPPKVEPAMQSPAPSAEEPRQFYRDENAQNSESSSLAVDSALEIVEADSSTTLQTNVDRQTQSVTWTASEFISHEKSLPWYGMLAGGTAIVAGMVFLITRDWFSTFIVVIAGILFGVAASRQPRQLKYVIDQRGISIGPRSYPYADFRSFSITEEGSFRSITFMPLKRFSVPLSVFYDPADEHLIAEVLASHLPMQDHPNDPIERLMRHIRF